MKLEIQKIYNLPRHSFLLLLCVSETIDPCVFVVKDLGDRPEEESSSSGSEDSDSVPIPPTYTLPEESSSSSEEGSSSGDEEEGEELCAVDPFKALVAISSLEDMLYAPKGPVERGTLYRSSVVSMLFKSKEALEQTLEEVISDLRILAVLLDIPVISFESKVFEDDNDDVDEDSIYWMPPEN
jgi:hypothetical protein